MKIMIVEDHAGMRRMLKSLISASLSESIEFVECESGEEAVSEYGRQNPDCVLMDFELQQIDGLETTEKIFGLDTQAAVVMVTSHDSPALRKKANQMDLHGFISKDNLSEITPILQTITSQ